METITNKMANDLVTRIYDIICLQISDIEGITACNQAWEAAKLIAIATSDSKDMKEAIKKLK